MTQYEFLYELIRNLTRLFAGILLLKYTVFLLAAPFHTVKEALRRYRIIKIRGDQPYRPLVTVLIPAWNEEVGIISTLRSILENTYPRIQVIVINDGSTDTTDLKMRRFIERNEKQFNPSLKSVEYLYKENGGKGMALNYGIDRAAGEIILTIDADSVADRHMVANVVAYFGDDAVDAVVGNVKVGGDISFLNLLQRLEYLFGFYHKRAHSVLGAEYIFGGACAAFRKKTVFDEIGQFDTTSITEDIELSLRTRFYGLQAVFATDAICYTEGASSLLGLIKQRLRWKKGRFEAFGKYKSLFLSTKKHHNRWLAWFILPLALLSEIQLLFEPIGLTLLVLYSMITGDYSSLILGALFMAIMYLVVGLFTEKGRNWWIIPLIPFTWMIFYCLVWIEYIALIKSISTMLTAETVNWQKWKRKGIGYSARRARLFTEKGAAA